MHQIILKTVNNMSFYCLDCLTVSRPVIATFEHFQQKELVKSKDHELKRAS